MNEILLDSTNQSQSAIEPSALGTARNAGDQGLDLQSEEEPQPFLSLPPSDPSSHPFFLFPNSLAKVVHTIAPSDAALRGALMHLGYRTTRSHIKPGSIVTDAPFNVIWEIMREWVRQKSPIKEGCLGEKTAGAGIMRQARDRKSIEMAREELKKVLNEKLESTNDLKTKIEALLYRVGKTEEHLPSEVKATEAEGYEKSVDQDQGTTSVNGNNSHNTGDDDKGAHADVVTSALEIKFDEALGKEPSGKRMVRYQLNPRADWAPCRKRRDDLAPYMLGISVRI